MRLLRTLSLPSSVIAGALALLIGPQVLGGVTCAVGGPETLAAGAIPAAVLDVWGELPVLLISVVFAALFIGKHIPGLAEIWRKAGPQVALGQTIAWGQYVGITLCIVVLTPVFGLDPMAGALLEIGFEGGHGTAAGLPGTFEEFGFAEGTDNLALLGAVALVPFPTSLIGRDPTSRAAVVPYLALLTLIALLHLALLVRAWRVDAWRRTLPPGLFGWLAAGWGSSTAVTAVALAVGSWVPVAGLAMLLLTWPTELVVARSAPPAYREWG